MKRDLFIIAIVACLGTITFSSYEHGPAYEGGLNKTGSRGGAANCAGSGCHDANTPTTIVAINVYNAEGTSVTQYAPGQTYTVAITGHHTTALSLSEFGFQVSAVNSGMEQAGAFAVPSGAHLRVTSLGGLQIVEHKEALSDSVTNYFVARFSWTAPAVGTGNVQFHGILNAFGGEGEGEGDEGDDDKRLKSGGTAFRMDDDDDEEGSDTTCPNVAPIVILTEGTGSGTNAVGSIAAHHIITVSPNPCTDHFNISINNTPGTYAVAVYSLNGQLVYSANARNNAVISMANAAAGIYEVVVTGSDTRSMTTILKR